MATATDKQIGFMLSLARRAGMDVPSHSGAAAIVVAEVLGVSERAAQRRLDRATVSGVIDSLKSRAA